MQDNPTNYFKNVRWPAGKKELQNMAKDNGAPEDFMNKLDDLPDETYRSGSEVLARLGFSDYQDLGDSGTHRRVA